MANPFGINESQILNDPRSKQYGNRWIILEREGNMIFAHLNDFTNLQESPAGFGSTVKGAVKELLSERKLVCRKAMWFGWGGPAGTCGEPAFSDDIHPNTLAMMLSPEIARCTKHGGLTLDAAADLAIYYRTDEANRAEALGWEATA